MSLIEQAGFNTPTTTLQLTTARWLNRRRVVRGLDGQLGERWSKVLAHTGSYEQFSYGTDTTSDWQMPVQRAIICSPWSGSIAVDVDVETDYRATRTAQIFRREHAISTRGFGYHILIDARAFPQDQWPTQGPIFGADIKSCGFIPVPGCQHYSGEYYQPVVHADGSSRSWPATPELMAAMVADRADYNAWRRSRDGLDIAGYGGSGNCSGHDGEVAATVLVNVLRSLTKEQCYAEWLKVAIPHDPGDPFTWGDFERHYHGALKKAAKIRANESQLVTPQAVRWAESTVQQPASPLLLVRSWAEAEASYRKWLHEEDQVPTRIIMATYLANMILTGDPVWTMQVGGSGMGKTMRIMPLNGLPGIVMASSITGEAALLSASPKRERASNATGGMLREVGDKGILVVKDFTSILSMSRDRRAEVIAAMREIYDGRWDRHYGADGGQVITWEGHCGFIAGCTTAIDTAHAVMNEMGTRFLFVRMPEADTNKIALSALRHAGSEHEMNAELSAVTHGLLRNPPGQPHELREEVETWLVNLAAMASRSRSPVLRDYSGEIEVIGDAEAPTRIIKQLGQLWKALGMLGLDENASWAAVQRAGLDSIPKLRRAVLHKLHAAGGWVTTRDVHTAVNHPYRTALRALEDLNAHGLVERYEESGAGPGRTRYSWALSEQALGWVSKLGKSGNV